MKISSIFYLVILVIVELLSVSSIKYWADHKNKPLFLYLGLGGYLLVGLIFAYILYVHADMTIVNAMWQVLNIILVSIVGIIIFKEKLTKIQYIGLFFAVLATILLALP